MQLKGNDLRPNVVQMDLEGTAYNYYKLLNQSTIKTTLNALVKTE